MMDEQGWVQVRVGGNRVLVSRTAVDAIAVGAESHKLVADRGDKVGPVEV
jgi:hypothetical protein